MSREEFVQCGPCMLIFAVASSSQSITEWDTCDDIIEYGGAWLTLSHKFCNFVVTVITATRLVFSTISS